MVANGLDTSKGKFLRKNKSLYLQRPYKVRLVYSLLSMIIILYCFDNFEKNDKLLYIFEK